MDWNAIVPVLVGIILGGGLTGALIPIFRYKADKGNIIAVGAEAAVASLKGALDRSDLRVASLEKELEKCGGLIADLKTKVEEAYETVKTLTGDLEQTKKRLDKVLNGKGSNGTS
jgi:chromosome segregation ATPase